MDYLLALIAEYTAYPEYVLSAGMFVVSVLALKFLQLVILSRLKALAKRTENDVDDVLIDIVSHVRPTLYTLISVYVALLPLTIPNWITSVVHILLILGIAQFAIKGIIRILDYVVARYIAKQEEESGESHAEHTEAMLKIFRAIFLIILWGSVFLFLLSNSGVNITSLIASLGVGGIAIALALQNVLGDLLASFSIFLDTPFKVGDFIKFGEHIGTVEKVGIRSTRIRTPHGEQLVVPNTQLVSAEIQNFRRMERRREVMTIGVVYELSAAVLKEIPTIIKDIVDSVDSCTFDRCHFSAFGDSAIMFETVYYVDVAGYAPYMDAKQDINLQLFEAFEKKKIGFAYPTQTVYVAK